MKKNTAFCRNYKFKPVEEQTRTGKKYTGQVPLKNVRAQLYDAGQVKGMIIKGTDPVSGHDFEFIAQRGLHNSRKIQEIYAQRFSLEGIWIRAKPVFYRFPKGQAGSKKEVFSPQKERYRILLPKPVCEKLGHQKALFS